MLPSYMYGSRVCATYVRFSSLVIVAVVVSVIMYITTQGIQQNLDYPSYTQVDGNVGEQVKVRHIGFLKVHKAASSTMQNMFFRFGLKRNLTFVFTIRPNYFSRSSKKHIPLAVPKYRTSYDILCNHGVFNYNIYSSILPKDTVYVGIVRDPLSLFISAVNYYMHQPSIPYHLAHIPGNVLQNLIQHPERYDREFFSLTKNVMARDFGFPETFDSLKILSYLEKIDSVFKLVLIVEHFEESLVLMKRYFNWSLQDILFISNNVNTYSHGWSMEDITSNDVDQFKKRNHLDYIIYNHFYKKFLKQISEESIDIWDEISHYKSMLTLLQSFCFTRYSKRSSSFEFNATKWNENFSIEKSECNLMKKEELKFIELLRIKQGSELK